MDDRRLSWVCTCIGQGHDHEAWHCQRISKIMGGLCQECLYWRFDHPESVPSE